MPVDPGVYVLTAYPAAGERGGPSEYHVYDLREGSPHIAEIDGVPNAILPKAFELEEGLLVRVQLRDFPIATTKVVPLDTGSWAAQSNWEGYDLNDPQTCRGSAGRGCTIRRLRPSDTPIALLINGRLQFTTRSRGATDCE